MKYEELLTIFETHKDGKIRIEHHPFNGIPNISITLEDFYRMFELVKEKRANAVRQD